MLRKCSVCEREFAVGLYGEKYTTVCPECRAIDEPRMKKETELRSEIIYILTVKMLPSEAIPIVDRILTLFREAGWKSPEECTQCIYDLQGIGERAKDNGYVKEIKNDTR